MINSRRSWPQLAAVAILPLGLATATFAQDAAPAPPATTATPARPGAAQPHGREANPSAGQEQPRLPPDSTTKQTVVLPGRTLNFSATAGSIRLFNDKNEPQADIAYTAYQLDGAEAGTRPVTFLVNGGPGASSAWLQFGAAGPWRLPIGADAAFPSASPALQPNAETWLDFSDLVFIDPVGTGYSRFIASGDDVRKRIYSVNGDIASITLTIRRWLEKTNRLTSPKFVVGESYGGFRGPRIVQNLQMDQGVGVNGLILISPLLDYRQYSGTSLLQYVGSLPSMTAIARAKSGPVTRTDMAEVETYAGGEYLTDLVKGLSDAEATTRLADKVAALTGIDPVVSRRLAGRFRIDEFRREFDRRNGRVIGRYDGTISGYDPNPHSSNFSFGDPSGDTLQAPLTSAAVDLYTRKLNWRPDGSYEILNGAVNRAWDFGGSTRPPESLTQLRQVLARDSKLKLLVTHGLFDLATPYFATKISLDQLPDFARSGRAKFVVYPGGHMFYARDDARQALRDEAQDMMK